MATIFVFTLTLPCLIHVVVTSSETYLQYDHSFDPQAYRNPGKVEYHIDLDSRIERALNSETELRDLYNHYRSKHSVSHGHHETTERLRLFRQFLVEIQELQRDESIAWTPGITLMAHMTECEQELMTSGNVTDHLDSHLQGDECNEYKQDTGNGEENVLQALGSVSAYEAFDWRAVGAVTPVKRQAKAAGSCWTYVAVTPVEALIKKLSGELVALSTQELDDCVYYGYGKRYFKTGGMPHHAWDWMIKEGRIGYDAQIPVRGSYADFGGCSYGNWARNALAEHNVAMRSFAIFQEIDRNSKSVGMAVRLFSPVAVAINTVGSGLKAYKGGPFDPRTSDCEPGAKPTHGVTIVGYDTVYFYIKNSWGDHWGNDGYIWWVRAQGTKDCSLYRIPMIPTMVKTKKLEKN